MTAELTDQILDEIQAAILEGWLIHHNTKPISRIRNAAIIYRTPRLDVAPGRRREIDTNLIRKFGNPPYSMWTETDDYRFAIGCN